MAEIPRSVHHLLAVQHGNVSLDQLLAAGLSDHQLQHLVRRGRLLKSGRSVYRSPSVAVTEFARCAALCLGRPGVVITGPTAGRIWGLRKTTSDRRIHVLMQPAANSISPDPSIVVRRTETLKSCDVVSCPDGIRVTSRQRTSLELARVLDPGSLLSVIEQVMHDGRLTESEMREVAIGLTFRRPWVRTFLAQLDRRIAGSAAESDPEVRVGTSLESHGVVGLVRQHPIKVAGYGNIRFDLAVPSLRWAVEVDVFPTHAETIGARRDRARDHAAANAGWTVRRVTLAMYDHSFSATIESLVSEARSRNIALAS